MIALQQTQFLGKIERQKDMQGIVASITTYADTGYAESMHYHETFVLSMVLQGGNMEKRKHGTIERSTGKITFHNPGDLHQSLQIQPHSRHLNIELPAAFLRQYDLEPEAGELEKADMPDATFLMCHLYKELQYGNIAQLDIESLVIGLLHPVKKYLRSAGNPSWAGRVRELLYDHWNENIDLAALAKAANLHPSTLSACFPVYFGCTISEVRRKIKLEKAIALIKTKKHSLTQIAYECGFVDQSHFIRVCKEMTACTPSQLQRMFSPTTGD